MASTLSIIFFLIAFVYPTSVFCTSSFTAANHLKYWSENVDNNMPSAVLSKLSPMTKHDTEYFTSLLTDHFVSSDAKLFCSKANLACFSKLSKVLPSSLDWSVTSLDVEHVDPWLYFRFSILKQGNIVHLPNLHDKFPKRAFLPSQVASKIFVTQNDLQAIFPESFLIPSTKDAIHTTLLHCNSPPIRGEIKSCPKSLEEMIEFSKTALATKHLIALTSKSTTGSEKESMIANIRKLNGEKIVSCHEIFLPFVTYFCHLLSSTSLYVVDMVDPETKVPVNTLLAACHMDTSAWPKNHVVFKILKFSPGEGEACHWMAQIDLAWMGSPHA